MQQGAAPDLNQRRLIQPERLRQPLGQISDAAGMAFSFLVAQIKRTAPAFNGRFIRFHQFLICALQVPKHRRAVNRDRGLSSQNVQVLPPAGVRQQRAAVEHFEYSLQCPFGDQRHGPVSREAF